MPRTESDDLLGRLGGREKRKIVFADALESEKSVFILHMIHIGIPSHVVIELFSAGKSAITQWMSPEWGSSAHLAPSWACTKLNEIEIECPIGVRIFLHGIENGKHKVYVV